MLRVMNDTEPAGARLYDNSHRAAQAEQTREAILDALVTVLGRGVADLSMPAVARESGVSLRTVYRYFPTKRELLAQLNVRLDERIGYSLTPYPVDPDDLTDHVKRYFRGLEHMDDASRAARSTAVGRAVRDTNVPDKFQAVLSGLDPILRSLPDDVRAHLFNIVTTLFSQYTLQLMKDDLGISGEAAAESVVWAIKTLVDGATVRPPAAED
jgi:AcrR family transcriptional regulator